MKFYKLTTKQRNYINTIILKEGESYNIKQSLILYNNDLKEKDILEIDYYNPFKVKLIKIEEKYCDIIILNNKEYFSKNYKIKIHVLNVRSLNLLLIMNFFLYVPFIIYNFFNRNVKDM